MNHRLTSCLLLAVLGCAPDDMPAAQGGPAPTLPATPLAYAVPLPAHAQASLAPGVDNTPAANPLTDAGATLGRVLFYDRRLSLNGSTACATCHQPDLAFADRVVASPGFDGGVTARTSMGLIEVRFYARGRMFWDERAATLEEQVLRPIQDEVEMGLTLEELVDRIGAEVFYPPLFAAAFGDAEVTSERIAQALAQYVRSIVAFDSKWDQGVVEVTSIADPFPNYTAQENRGKAIFFGQHDPATRGLCGTCHMRDNPLAIRPPGAPPPPVTNIAFFQPIGPTNNGLPPLEGDLGVGGATGLPQDNNRFKPSSLRNIAAAGPYMHDGRFATLEDVVDFYDRGITAVPGLDPALRNPDGTPLRLRLPPEDRAALVAFLKTLTDASIATDPRFANPFPRP